MQILQTMEKKTDDFETDSRQDEPAAGKGIWRAMENVRKTNWIWIEDWQAADRAETGLVLFRKSLWLEGPARKGQIKVTADSRYKLYVSERLVEVGPMKGDDQIRFADTIDLKDFLRPGSNVIAVVVLAFPVDHDRGNHSTFRTGTPGLFLKGYVEDSTGRRHDVSADETWKCRKAEEIRMVREAAAFSPLMFYENACGNAELLGWQRTDYDDFDWAPAKPYDSDELTDVLREENLRERTIPFMRRVPGRFAGVISDKESVVGADAWKRLLGVVAGSILDKTAEAGQAAKPAEAEQAAGSATAKPAAVGPESAKPETAGPAAAKPAAGPSEGTKPASIRKGALTIPAYTQEVIELNAGEEMTGFLNLEMSGGAGAEIELLYSEAYVQRQMVGAQNLPLKTDRLDVEHGILAGYTDSYKVCGCGTDESPEKYSPFWFRTFRFIRLQIRTGKQPLTIGRLDYEEVGYPLEVKTFVRTSDPTHEKIWEISERTLRRCMHETYEDTPYYEQLQYAQDSRLQILYTYAVSGDDRLARQCMDDFLRSQRCDGLINCSYPNYEVNVIPGFSIYYILMIHDHMMYFGDKALVRRHMPAVERILDYFERNLAAQNYVRKIGGVNHEQTNWSFVDWTPEWDDTEGVPSVTRRGPITMESLQYIMGLQAAAELADYIGREDVAGDFRDRAAKVRQAVRTYCIGKNGMIQDGPGMDVYSQHCQVFGILTDTLTGETAREALKETIIRREQYAQCTVAMSYYLFRALEKTDLYEYTDHYWNVWRKMIDNHCTTCTEAEAYGRSECHAWGSLILYELPTIVLGVRPAAPGYEKMVVKPVPGYLTWAKGRVCTPKGYVDVEWEKDENGELKVKWEKAESGEVK